MVPWPDLDSDDSYEVRGRGRHGAATSNETSQRKLLAVTCQILEPTDSLPVCEHQ